MTVATIGLISAHESVPHADSLPPMIPTLVYRAFGPIIVYDSSSAYASKGLIPSQLTEDGTNPLNTSGQSGLI